MPVPHQTLEVMFGTPAEMQDRFDAAHEARYGFASPSRELIIDMLAAEAIGMAEAASDALAAGRLEDAMPRATVRMRSDGEWTDAPLYERDDLCVGQIVEGPAIVAERTGTNVVEKGWQARIDNFGNLVLTRVVEKVRQAALGTEADPIMLEVFNNLFMSIAEQMGATLANTAYSVNIKERLDFSCALFDGSGGLVANAPHVPVHLGSMSQSVRHGARDEPRPDPPRRQLHAEQPVRGRHASAGRHGDHAGLRRCGQGDPVLRRIARPSRRYRRAHAGIGAAGQPAY